MRRVSARMQQEAQVEMHVRVRAEVLVEVDEDGSRGGVHRGHAGLLASLTQSRVLWSLAVLDVTAGLQPEAQAAMLMEQEPTAREIDHEGRCREMSRQRRASEGIVLTGEQRLRVLESEMLLLVERSVRRQRHRECRTTEVLHPIDGQGGRQSSTVLLMTVPSRASS